MKIWTLHIFGHKPNVKCLTVHDFLKSKGEVLSHFFLYERLGPDLAGNHSERIAIWQTRRCELLAHFLFRLSRDRKDPIFQQLKRHYIPLINRE